MNYCPECGEYHVLTTTAGVDAGCGRWKTRPSNPAPDAPTPIDQVLIELARIGDLLHELVQKQRNR